MSEPHHIPLVILGGGIAGLWCLDALVRAGHDPLLISAGPLAQGQTLASQGIIHGGAKYTLNMQVSAASEKIAAMPGRWRACLTGKGETDLSGVTIRAENHMMWLPAQLGGGLMGFFASKAFRGRVDKLEQRDWPEIFQSPGFDGQLLQLDEVVIDVPSLIGVLARRHADRIVTVSGEEDLQLVNKDGEVSELILRGQSEHRLSLERLICCTGRGSAGLLQQLGGEAQLMQERPLRMVMLKPAPGDLFAHCVVKQMNPRLSITSHRTAAGEPVWYLGGDVAEKGAVLSEAESIALARAELAETLPWLDFSACRWATHHVSRAEGRQANGRRPDLPVIRELGNALFCWPTKLAFAPLLADLLLEHLPRTTGAAQRGLAGEFGPVEIAPAPWDEVAEWK